MTLRKTTSTNYLNEQELILECPMTFTYTLLGKRWKPIILWKIHEGDNRFSSLLSSIPLVSRKMLFQELASLQERQLVQAEGEGTSKRYRLTPLGESLMPLLREMWTWGEAHLPSSDS